MRDLIFVSMEDWDEIWRRNQFVCAELARRHPEMKILFVGLPRNLSHDLRRGRLKSLRTRGTWPVPGLANITVFHPWKVMPNTLALGRKINESLMLRQVRSAARMLGLGKPILWLNPHYAEHLAGRLGESKVIYDVTDDWIQLSQKSWLAQLTRRQDERLCRKADAVIVCSQRLYELKRSLTKNLYLIPNGVDAEHYRTVLDGNGPLPPVAADWKKPVLGYTGTIHADRVDVLLLERLAQNLPDASVVLIGPSFLGSGDLTRLQSCGNVVLTGPVPYGEIPNYMRAFDVCITPHRKTDFTESLNPIKLWEYLAAGKPIVSTDVAGFRDYPHLVRIAQGPEAFVGAVREALNENGERAGPRRDEAAKHSWRSRVDEIERILDGTEAPGSQGTAG